MVVVSDVRPGRIAGRRPDGVFHVMREGRGAGVRARGLTVRAVRLCEYVERPGAGGGGGAGGRGPYSLITAVVETDAGTAELEYDEGYRGADALGEAGRFLVGHLGASALVERAAIAIASRGGSGADRGGGPRQGRRNAGGKGGPARPT